MARSATKTLIGPRTDSERLVAEIWRELIGSDAFDVHAKFLDSGGQSLLIFQAAAKIARRTGIRLAPRVLAACTLAEIASRIESKPTNGMQPSRPSWLGKFATSLATAYKLRDCASVGTGARVAGRVWIYGEGRIVIGERVFLDGSRAPIEIVPERGAEIVIGNDVVLEGGSSIVSTNSVIIGARSHVGMFCKIMDNHFHQLGNRAERPKGHALVVEEDVRLGPYAILTAGAHVGRGAIVESRSVVGRTIEPGAVVRGNPAKAQAEE